MEYNKEYFYIDHSMLKGKELFSFKLYIYNNINKEHTLFLHANSPLNEKKQQLLSFILSKGGSLAIKREQERTFLAVQNIKKSDIPSLSPPEQHQLEKDRKLNIHLYEKHKEEFTFHFITEFKKSCETNDFTVIIDEARYEILTFENDISETTSLAIYLSGILLFEDNYINRAVALSYFIGKKLGFKDRETLGDIVCAAFLSHLGYTQLEYSITSTPSKELTDYKESKFMKHSGLSQHLFRKCKLNLSDKCLKGILEHHESYDGRGFPHNKAGQYIEPIALLIGVVYYMLEQSTGQIDGSKRDFLTIIKNIKAQADTNSNDPKFGDQIVECLEDLF